MRLQDGMADGFVKIRIAGKSGILRAGEFFLPLINAANVQLHNSFPPMTMTAVSVSSVICRNQPARSPVMPPNCLYDMCR